MDQLHSWAANQENHVVLEYLFSKPWNTVILELIKNKDCTNDPELLCRNLFGKLETIGCISDKKSAWNIAKFTACCLGHHVFVPDLISGTDLFSSILNDPTDPFKVKSLHRIELPRSELLLFKFLLNYGLVEPIDIDSELDLEEVRQLILLCFFSTPEISWGDFFDTTVPIMRKQIGLLSELRSSNGRLYGGAFQRGFKRLMLTAKCIAVLERKFRQGFRGNTAEHYAQCLRLYFRGVSDPFIQADEIREYVTFFFGEDATKGTVDTMVAVFKSLFPESVAPYGPRSLKHLCRCQVRDVLSSKSEVLPELLNSLNIPNRLKVYILGDS